MTVFQIWSHIQLRVALFAPLPHWDSNLTPSVWSQLPSVWYLLVLLQDMGLLHTVPWLVKIDTKNVPVSWDTPINLWKPLNYGAPCFKNSDERHTKNSFRSSQGGFVLEVWGENLPTANNTSVGMPRKHSNWRWSKWHLARCPLA